MTGRSIDRDRVIRAAWELLELARKGTPLMGSEGNPVLVDGEPVYVPNLTVANRMVEILATVGGFMIERREVTIHAPDGMPGGIAEIIETDVLAGRMAGSG